MTSAENDPVTLGEVARNLERLAEQMEKGFARVDERFNGLAMVHTDVYLADRAADAERHKRVMEQMTSHGDAIAAKADKEEVNSIRALSMWALGLVGTVCFGAIVLAILAAVFKAGG